MDFFPEPLAPTEPEEPDEPVQPAWTCAPHDVLPGVVPIEMILGRSENTVVQLSGMRVFPTGVEMTLSVRLRGSIRDFDLNRELFDGPYRRDMGAEWQAGRLKWGFEFADGRRVTNVDPAPWSEAPDEVRTGAAGPGAWAAWEPSRPVLQAGGGGVGPRYADHKYWLWPLPPAGPLLVVCQWPARGIGQTIHEIDGGTIVEAAARARPLWSGHPPLAQQ